MAAVIALLAIACAAGVGLLAALWISWRRERQRGYQPAHKIRPRPGSTGLPGPPPGRYGGDLPD